MSSQHFVFKDTYSGRQKYYLIIFVLMKDGNLTAMKQQPHSDQCYKKWQCTYSGTEGIISCECHCAIVATGSSK